MTPSEFTSISSSGSTCSVMFGDTYLNTIKETGAGFRAQAIPGLRGRCFQ
ncbi:MAG: hypothetical protein ACI9PP_000927 [Halobacteriales archaeon]